MVIANLPARPLSSPVPEPGTTAISKVCPLASIVPVVLQREAAALAVQLPRHHFHSDISRCTRFRITRREHLALRRGLKPTMDHFFDRHAHQTVGRSRWHWLHSNFKRSSCVIQHGGR